MAIVILKFKNTVIKEYLVGKGKILIGRSPDCHITIDNPTVTKCHASIEYRGGAHWLTDLKSTNGTCLNKKKISSSQLSDDDIIMIGKHTLTYMETEDLPTESFAGFGDQTIVLPSKEHREPVRRKKPARLSVIESHRRKEYSLSREETFFGRGAGCSIKVAGFLTPRKIALIRREGRAYYLYANSGWFTITVNGEPVGGGVKLRENDRIQIRDMRFVFKDEQEL